MNTYEQIEAELRSCHFYPDKVVTNGKTTGLQVQASPILMDSKKQRLEEILEGQKVKISKMPNEGYILIKKIK